MIKISLTLNYRFFEALQASHWWALIGAVIDSSKCISWEYEEGVEE